MGHPLCMPLVDVVDDTFVVVHPSVLAAVVADPRRPARWWPDLALTTTRDRGTKGRQWRVDDGGAGLVGSAEVWLEPWGDGVVVHLFLRLDPVRAAHVEGAALQRWASAERRRRAQSWKRSVHALKDELEAGRAPGAPAEEVTS